MTDPTIDLTKLIDALFECVNRSDWNCVAHDKPELYNIWNYVNEHPELKSQLVDKLMQADKDKEKIEFYDRATFLFQQYDGGLGQFLADFLNDELPIPIQKELTQLREKIKERDFDN